MPTSIFIESTFTYTAAQLLVLASNDTEWKLIKLVSDIGSACLEAETQIYASLIDQKTIDSIDALDNLSPHTLNQSSVKERERQDIQYSIATRLLAIVNYSRRYIPIMIALVNCIDINDKLTKPVLFRLFNILSNLREKIQKLHSELLSLDELIFDKNTKAIIQKIRHKLCLSASLITVDRIQRSVMKWHNAKTGVFESDCKLSDDAESNLDALILSEATLVDAWKNPNAATLYEHLKTIYMKTLHSEHLPLALQISLLLLAYMPNKTPYINTISQATTEQVSASLPLQGNLLKLATDIKLLSKKHIIDIKLPELDFSSDYYRISCDSMEEALPYVESLVTMAVHFYWLSTSKLDERLRFNGMSAGTIVLVLLIQLELVIHDTELRKSALQEELARINQTPDLSSEEQVQKHKLQVELAFESTLTEKSRLLNALKITMFPNIARRINDTSILMLYLILQQRNTGIDQIIAKVDEIQLALPTKDRSKIVSFTVAPFAHIIFDLIATTDDSMIALSTALKKLFDKLFRSPESVQKLWRNSPYSGILCEKLGKHKESQHTIISEFVKQADKNKPVKYNYWSQENSRHGYPLLKGAQISTLLSELYTQVAVAKARYAKALSSYLSVQPLRGLTITPDDFAPAKDTTLVTLLAKILNQDDLATSEEELKAKCELAFTDMPLNLCYQDYAKSTLTTDELIRADSAVTNNIAIIADDIRERLDERRSLRSELKSLHIIKDDSGIHELSEQLDINKKTLNSLNMALLEKRAEHAFIMACREQIPLRNKKVGTREEQVLRLIHDELTQEVLELRNEKQEPQTSTCSITMTRSTLFDDKVQLISDINKSLIEMEDQRKRKELRLTRTTLTHEVNELLVELQESQDKTSPTAIARKELIATALTEKQSQINHINDRLIEFTEKYLAIDIIPEKEILSKTYHALMREANEIQEKLLELQSDNRIKGVAPLAMKAAEKESQIRLIRSRLAERCLEDLASARQGYASLMVRDRFYMQRESNDPYRDDSAEIPGMTLPLLVEVTQYAFAQTLRQYQRLQEKRNNYVAKKRAEGIDEHLIDAGHLKLLGNTLPEHERMVILAAQDYKNTLTLFGKEHVAELIPMYTPTSRTAPVMPPACLQLLAGLYIAANNEMLDSPTFARAQVWAERPLPAVGVATSLQNSSTLFTPSPTASSVSDTPEPSVTLQHDSDAREILAAYRALLEALNQPTRDISRFSQSVKESFVRWTGQWNNSSAIDDQLRASIIPTSSSTSAPYSDASLPQREAIALWLERVSAAETALAPRMPSFS